jgi:hypothetical protein
VFLFDRKGVILRRVGLTFLDVRPERMKVTLFDLPELQCAEVGRLLVNGIPVCASAAGGPVKGCADILAVSTRATAELVY